MFEAPNMGNEFIPCFFFFLFPIFYFLIFLMFLVKTLFFPFFGCLGPRRVNIRMQTREQVAVQAQGSAILPADPRSGIVALRS